MRHPLPPDAFHQAIELQPLRRFRGCCAQILDIPAQQHGAVRARHDIANQLQNLGFDPRAVRRILPFGKRAEKEDQRARPHELMLRRFSREFHGALAVRQDRLADADLVASFQPVFVDAQTIHIGPGARMPVEQLISPLLRNHDTVMPRRVAFRQPDLACRTAADAHLFFAQGKPGPQQRAADRDQFRIHVLAVYQACQIAA